MSSRPRLAVLGVLAAVGAAAGAYFLWPSARHVASCPSLHAPTPSAAKKALAAYAGRIRHTIERQPGAARQELWSDPLGGRTRQLIIRPDGRIASALTTIRTRQSARS